MNIGTKKFLARYGLKFAGIYVLGFIVLVTFAGRFKATVFPGDILIQRESFTIYFPFTSSLAIAVFVLIIFEVYKNIR